MHTSTDAQRTPTDLVSSALTHIARDSDDSIIYERSQSALLAVLDLHTNQTVRDGLTACYPARERKRREREYVQGVILAKELE